MYQVSDQWVQDKIKQACEQGYVTVAFGLRLRTPLLKQVMFGSSKMPYEAAKEARTAGNALGQSYGLLNNRAAIDLKSRLDPTPFRTKILPIMHIHDASYYLVENKVENVHWLNIQLPDCMSWQNLPEIQHTTVKLSGDLEIFHPNWTKKYSLTPGASMEEIIQSCQKKIMSWPEMLLLYSMTKKPIVLGKLPEGYCHVIDCNDFQHNLTNNYPHVVVAVDRKDQRTARMSELSEGVRKTWFTAENSYGHRRKCNRCF